MSRESGDFPVQLATNLRLHSTILTTTPTPTATRPTRLHPYVRHPRFPLENPCEDVGVGVVKCGLY